MKKTKNKKPKEGPKKFREVVSYSSLIGSFSNWGQEFKVEKEAQKFKKSPSIDALKLAYLDRILYSLKDIHRELKREKIIK